MTYFAMGEAAKKLGIGIASLSRYIEDGNVPAPEPTRIGKRDVRAWSEEDVERVRELLPKIANGRKTRYQKKRPAVGGQQSAKTKAQPGAAVPHKQRKPKKK